MIHVDNNVRKANLLPIIVLLLGACAVLCVLGMHLKDVALATCDTQISELVQSANAGNDSQSECSRQLLDVIGKNKIRSFRVLDKTAQMFGQSVIMVVEMRLSNGDKRTVEVSSNGRRCWRVIEVKRNNSVDVGSTR